MVDYDDISANSMMGNLGRGIYKKMKRFCICSPRSHLNDLAFVPPDWGMPRRSRCVLTFLVFL